MVNEKDALTALVIAVVLKTAERIGNEESSDNGRYGVTMLKKKHITISGNTVTLSYVGKSGTPQDKSFTDETIAAALKKAIKNSPSSFIFTTSEGFQIRADRVNAYLEDNYQVTAKDIRELLSNQYLIDKLKTLTPEKNEQDRTKQFKEAVKYAAEKVGHGAPTAKKHYVLPELEKKFIKYGKILDLSDFYKTGGMVKMEKGGEISYEEINEETGLPSDIEYWDDAGAGVLIVAASTGRGLLVQRSENSNEGGTWAQVGGRLDEGENPITAAKREVKEELGYTLRSPLHLAFLYRDGDFTYSNFIAVVANEFKPQLNYEHSDYQWVELDRLPEPVHFGITEMVEKINLKDEIQKATDLFNKKGRKLASGGEVSEIGVQVVYELYAELENKIKQASQSTLSVTKWKEIVGMKSDAAKFTGIDEWFSVQRPDSKVFRGDILKFLNDHRIKIVERDEVIANKHNLLGAYESYKEIEIVRPRNSDTPTKLGELRLDVRIDSRNGRILFVEEIQAGSELLNLIVKYLISYAIAEDCVAVAWRGEHDGFTAAVKSIAGEQKELVEIEINLGKPKTGIIWTSDGKGSYVEPNGFSISNSSDPKNPFKVITPVGTSLGVFASLDVAKGKVVEEMPNFVDARGGFQKERGFYITEAIKNTAATKKYESGGSVASKSSIKYYNNCVNYTNLKELDAIVGQEKEISRKEFVENVDEASRIDLENSIRGKSTFPIEEDWGFKYFKSKGLRGESIYFIRNSGIEFVFSTKGKGVPSGYYPFGKYEKGGEIMEGAGAVRCDECGWAWELTESEPHDKYVCHNCGRDNSPEAERFELGGDVVSGGIKIKTPTQSEITEIVRTHPLLGFKGVIKNAYIVGSFAKGTAVKDSDIDILLEVDKQGKYAADEITDLQHDKIKQYFINHDLHGLNDNVHPQWEGHRLDFYYTYEPRLSNAIKLPKAKHENTSGTANEGLVYLLGEKGSIPAIGEERGNKVKDGIVLYKSPVGSYRYVMYENGTAISAIQLMSRDGKSAYFANAYTLPDKRGEGIGKILYNEAAEHFKSIDINTDRSKQGEWFVRSIEKSNAAILEKGGDIPLSKWEMPSKRILSYAEEIKDKHYDVWMLGGNEFGNTAFKMLKHVIERGHWEPEEEWFFKKWQAFKARHAGDFHIAGVIANLKWLAWVSKGEAYSKEVINDAIIQHKGGNGAIMADKASKFVKGGDLENSENRGNFTSNNIKDEVRNIIQGTGRVTKGTAIQAASAYLRANASAGSEGEESKSKPRKNEREKLEDYISEKGLWFNIDHIGVYLTEGVEQKVYRFDAAHVIKLNAKVYYKSWESYFNSLLLHNYFFPLTAYELIGFIRRHGELHAVVKQTFIETAEKTDLSLAKKFMADNGFINTKNDDYKNDELGIRLEDLHDENVLTKDGVLYFIDTVFYPIHGGKKFEKGGDLEDSEKRGNIKDENEGQAIWGIIHGNDEKGNRTLSQASTSYLRANAGAGSEGRTKDGRSWSKEQGGDTSTLQERLNPQHIGFGERMELANKASDYSASYSKQYAEELNHVNYVFRNAHKEEVDAILAGGISGDFWRSEPNEYKNYGDFLLVKKTPNPREYSSAYSRANKVENDGFNYVGEKAAKKDIALIINKKTGETIWNNNSIAKELPVEAASILDKVKKISESGEYLNCDSFCSRLVDNKLFKSEFADIEFKPKSKKLDGQLQELLTQLKVGDIVAFGEKRSVRHYAMYIGGGKVIEVEQWGAKPREYSLEKNLNEYEAVAHIYRDKAEVFEDGGDISMVNKSFGFSERDTEATIKYFFNDFSGFDYDEATEKRKEKEIRQFLTSDFKINSDGTLNGLENFPAEIRLYRLLCVEDKIQIDMNNLGNHWTYDKVRIHTDDFLLQMDGSNCKKKLFLVEAVFSKDSVDAIETLCHYFTNDIEHEIFIKSGEKPVAIDIKEFHQKREHDGSMRFEDGGDIAGAVSVTVDEEEYNFKYKTAEAKVIYYGNHKGMSPNYENTNEAYIDYIHRGDSGLLKRDEENRGAGSYLLNYIKQYFKNKGADFLTLKVENGLGFGGRNNNPLAEYYLRNGFKYSYTEEEVKRNDEKNLGGMYCDLRKDVFEKGGSLANDYDKIIHSPEFISWFGNWKLAYKTAGLDFMHPAWKNVSKVVDDKGLPLIVYHAMNSEVYNDVFTIPKKRVIRNSFGNGVYFSPIQEYVLPFGKIIRPYFLLIKSPYIWDNALYEEIGSDRADYIRNAIIAKGHDGVLVPNGLYPETEPYKYYEIVAMYPNQIKLADGTNTAFDGNNPDIKFEDGGDITGAGSPQKEIDDTAKILAEVVKHNPDALSAIIENYEKNQPPIIEEETYLAMNGASRQSIGDSALHKNKGSNSDKTWRKIVDAQAQKDAFLCARREVLREEYAQMIAKGAIRLPTRMEKLISSANGHPDNESVMASRRICEKRGINWQDRSDARILSEIYSRAKADGKNPELVKAVEELMKGVKV